MTAKEALEWGFVDEIIEDKPKITNMKKFQNLTEEEQAEMDQLLADKAALEQKVAELEAQLTTAASEGAQMRPFPRSCINCGQTQETVIETANGYHCPVCNHNWTKEDELAPFRVMKPVK